MNWEIIRRRWGKDQKKQQELSMHGNDAYYSGHRFEFLFGGCSSKLSCDAGLEGGLLNMFFFLPHDRSSLVYILQIAFPMCTA
eukprot:Gb_06327 [translate_table: standard]